MKKTVLCLLAAALLMALPAGCAGGESVPLAGVTVDGMAMGDAVSAEQLSGYTVSDRYSGDYRYKFDELVLDEEEGRVTYLFSRFDEGKTTILVNGAPIATTQEVKAVLGDGCQNKMADREQRLRSIVYNDRENRITATFVYQCAQSVKDADGDLLWVYLERT